MLFVNNVAQNAMIKIVIKELVNKVNEVKSLSLALAPCNKLLQVRNY